MDFKLSTQQNEEVHLLQIDTSKHPDPLITEARGLEASGDFGVVRFYQVECPDFNICYCNYNITRHTTLSAWMDAPMLVLHFTMSNTMHYKLEGLPETVLLQGQFNLIYAPVVKNKFWFRKDETYTTFGIHFSVPYVEKIAVNFPLLQQFVEKVKEGTAGILGRHHGLMTPDMSRIIRNLLNCQYKGDVKNVYLEAKVLELFVLALDQISNGNINKSQITLRPYDIEKIHEAHDYLISNLDNPCTLIELAHKVGINDFKLKKGFKQIFGTTVYESLIDARMEKAKYLLLETETAIEQIAYTTGYKNLSSFITAFKKKMGYSPGSYKRMKRSDNGKK
jgi:AraC family transcriptional regulator, transcriptional activator of the genes for pyochelin and ferripyochelin receptors